MPQPYGMPAQYQMGPNFQMGQQDMYNFQQQQLLSDLYGRQMQMDLARGREYGAQAFAPGSLGSVEEGRSGEVTDYLAQLQGATAGYTAPQYQAIRDRMSGDINRDYATNLRQMQFAQGGAGVRGAAATAQQSQLSQEKQNQMGRNYQDLMIADVGERSRAQQAYGQAMGGARQDEMARQMYNQQQRAKEAQGRQAYEFGYAGLGAAQRGAAQKYVAGQQQINAAQQDTGGGGKF